MDRKKQKRGVCLDYGFKALPSLRVGAQGHENGPSTQGDGVSQEGERKGKTWGTEASETLWNRTSISGGPWEVSAAQPSCPPERITADLG